MSNSSVTGSVKFFNAAKGFGFIAPEDGGKDVFVPAASIAASGLARLKAGQRVSFDLEPDAKGPKAVKLTVLEDAPAPPPAHATMHAPNPNHPEVRRQPVAPPARKSITVYSDSATANGAVEDVVEALTEAGETPLLVEISAATRDQLMQLSLLLREADQSLVRRYDPLFLALQLDDRFISEADFWTGIVEHPSLVNSPVVATAGKARICKSASDVKTFLGAGAPAPVGGKPPQDKPKGISPRMAALMRGESLPPRPVAPPPEPPAKAQTKPAAELKPAAKAMAPVKAAADSPKSAKPAAKPKTAAPVKKAAAKVAPKPVKKPATAPAKAKKKK